MHATGSHLPSVSDYDWSASPLGAPDNWPLPLKIAAELLLGSPLPALLAWGDAPVILFNEAYGELAGPSYGKAPGGTVPPVMPPPLVAAREAVAAARAGGGACVHDVALAFLRAGGRVEERRDLSIVPLRGAQGAVEGVFLTLAAPAAPVAEAPARSGSLRILVVEDNLDSQYLVCEMLRAFGHHADGVGHPTDALARLAAERYDVLFSDVSLPGMSGVDLARQALAGQHGIKVIFASGYGDTLLRHLDFPYVSLQKPYELDQLQEALDRVSAPAARG